MFFLVAVITKCLKFLDAFTTQIAIAVLVMHVGRGIGASLTPIAGPLED